MDAAFAADAPAGLDAAASAARLPYAELADEIARLLGDAAVRVPPRLVQALPALDTGAAASSLFVMPAHDARIAIVKLITVTPANAGRGRPVLQGDVLVFDIATGRRLAMLDGPTVTARRTAAVSLLAARRLARVPTGPLLIVGAGVQGRAHLEAFAAGLGVRAVQIVSRTRASADALAAHANGLGLDARVHDEASAVDAALADCPLVVTCTPADRVVLRGPLRADAFAVAVGAFRPDMVELAPELCHDVATRGTVVVDTPDALREAGDLLQAGLDVAALPDLAQVVNGAWAAHSVRSPVLFKSCGWAGWDLAAARLATRGAALPFAEETTAWHLATRTARRSS